MDTFDGLESEIMGLKHETSTLENVIAGLRTRMHKLQARQNALTPFGRLPADILVCIMEILVASDRQVRLRRAAKAWNTFEEYDDDDDEVDGWACVTGVCTRVRTLALDTASLWADINLNSRHEWVNLCMQRSRAVPLTVIFYNSLPRHPDHCYSCYDRNAQHGLTHAQLDFLYDAFKDAMPRARHAYIHITAHFELGSYLHNVFCGHALPRLRSLIYIKETYDQDYYPYTQHSYHIDEYDDSSELSSSSHFLQGATQLMRLQLSTTELSFDNVDLPFLSYLRMQDVTVLDSPSEFVAFVQRSPRLEHVHLQIKYPKPSSRYDDIEWFPNFLMIDEALDNGPASEEPQEELVVNITRISLPCLHTLHLELSVDQALCHLQALPDPSETLRVNVMLPDDRVDPKRSALMVQIYEHVSPLLDVSADIPVALVNAGSDSRLAHAHIQVSHLGIHTRCVLLHLRAPLEDLADVLSRVRVMHAASDDHSYPTRMFTQENLQLSALEHLILGPPPSARFWEEIELWLRTRAQVRRVQTVDLRTYGRYGPLSDDIIRPEMRECLLSRAHESMKGGLCDQVLVDGGSIIQRPC